MAQTYILPLFLGLQVLLVHCQRTQYFIEEPEPTLEVIEHATAILRCKVGNQAGRVQWTKDGFALGFNRSITGYPRYKVEGDPSKGEHHLKITNISLLDDANYQCQVGPSGNHPSIRATGKLVVLLAPTSIEIIGRNNGETIELQENSEVTIECVAKDGKPAAVIKWYKNNAEIKLDSQENFEEDGSSAPRKTVRSKITIVPRSSDDNAKYSCMAQHKALPAAMTSSVILSVQYPPGPPEISGYSDGELIRINESVTLTCRSRGGNPLAQLVWFKNGEQIDFSYTTSERTSTNTHVFHADTSDDNATYRCEASNIMVTNPLKASVRLTVRFAPSKVTVTGDSKAKVGDTVAMTCQTSNSNPPAKLSWVVNGRPMASNHSTITVSPLGGWITTANITTVVAPQERNMMFSCYAYNDALGKNIVETRMLSILYPPQTPSIIGYDEGVPIVAGKVQRVTCIALEGNPLATLKWFKGTKELKSIYTESENLASAELEIVATPSDNGQEYRCEASNEATTEALVSVVVMSVHFPPAAVKVKVRPKRLQEGDKATLTCQSSTSNPQSNLTWWRDGFVVPGGESEVNPGSHGGMTTRSVLQIEVTSKDDGAVYTCQGTSHELGQSVHDAATLEVLYKPAFIETPQETVSVTEGDSKVINISAKANPSSITYVWTRGDQAIPNVNRTYFDEDIRVFSDGPVLNLTRVTREDLGLYQLEATNERGSSKAIINMDVQYPAEITQVTTPILINPGNNAFLECHVNGNPVNEETVTWQRDEYDMEVKTRTAYSGDISYLTVFNVSREDTGVFKCVSSNGIGDKMEKEAVLIVKFKPEIDQSPQYSKSATEKGSSAKLTCVAEGAPNVTFTWTREGVTIQEDTDREKYTFGSTKTDLVRYESVMTVANVNSADYGPYDCIARNELGFSTATVKLDVTSHPDPPHGVRALNSTHDSVVLDWQPSFDGGLPQTYRVRYKPASSLGYQYVDVSPFNTTLFRVSGLRLGTEYSFNVMALNEKGESAYTTEIVKATTLSEPLENDVERMASEVLNEKKEIPKIVIITVSVIGGLLLVINIFLVICFIRRRQKKRLESEASEQGSSKSATIEMYAPSTYNETVTGETLSSISEKSENYSHEDSVDDYPVRKIEETGKNAASTYLIDQLEPPPSYTGFRQPDSYLPPRDRLHYTTNEEDKYADALRRNAYNQSLNEVDCYGKHVMMRSPSDMMHIPPDSRYVPYPPQKYISPNGTLHPNQMNNQFSDHSVRNGSISNINGSLPYMHSSGRHVGAVSPSPSPTQQPVLSTFGPSLSPSPMDQEYEGHLV